MFAHSPKFSPRYRTTSTNTNANPERTRTRTPTQSERERDLDRNHERCQISSLARAREKTNTPLVHAHQPAADAAKSVRPSIPPSTFPRLCMVLGANSHWLLVVLGSTRKLSFVSNGVRPSTKAVSWASTATWTSSYQAPRNGSINRWPVFSARFWYGTLFIKELYWRDWSHDDVDAGILIVL